MALARFAGERSEGSDRRTPKWTESAQRRSTSLRSPLAPPWRAAVAAEVGDEEVALAEELGVREQRRRRRRRARRVGGAHERCSHRRLEASGGTRVGDG